MLLHLRRTRLASLSATRVLVTLRSPKAMVTASTDLPCRARTAHAHMLPGCASDRAHPSGNGRASASACTKFRVTSFAEIPRSTALLLFRYQHCVKHCNFEEEKVRYNLPSASICALISHTNTRVSAPDRTKRNESTERKQFFLNRHVNPYIARHALYF
jgi:hypothetical protein